MSYIKYSGIPKLTAIPSYCIDVPVGYVTKTIEEFKEDFNLQLNPDFQRGHVWKTSQQKAFVEYLLRGGTTDPIKLNHPNWQYDCKPDDTFVCVDGLQRLTAIMKFEANELKVFGQFKDQFPDKLRQTVTIKIAINSLKTRAQVLQWYLELNSTGTRHTKMELSRVEQLLFTEKH